MDTIVIVYLIGLIISLIIIRLVGDDEYMLLDLSAALLWPITLLGVLTVILFVLLRKLNKFIR